MNTLQCAANKSNPLLCFVTIYRIYLSIYLFSATAQNLTVEYWNNSTTKRNFHKKIYTAIFHSHPRIIVS